MIFYTENDKSDELVLKQSLQELQTHFQIEPADLPDLSRSDFGLLKYYTNFLNRQTVRINNTETYISFVEVEYPLPASKYGKALRKDFHF